MSSPIADWLEAQADRDVAHQRGQADSAKLVATFSGATAATLVATALQVEPVKTADVWASGALGLTLLFVLAVIFLDGLDEVDADAVLRQSHLEQWDKSKTLDKLRSAKIGAVQANRATVKRIKFTLRAELVVAFLTMAIAIQSLLT